MRLAASLRCLLAAARAVARSRPRSRRHAARRARRRACRREVARSRCKVALPEGLHTQSEQAARPDADSDRADGRRARRASRSTEIVFPTPTDLKQAGQDQPLAVFEQRVRDRRAADASRADVPPGDLVVPGDAALSGVRRRTCCYPPMTAERRVDAAVVGAGDAAVDAATPTSSRRLRSARGEKPAAPAPSSRRRRRSRRQPAPPARRRSRQLDDFTVLGTTGGYLSDRRFPAVHPQRRNRREGARAVRGPRAAGDSADRVPRRPGAEPHAVRAADDSDQPRDHRRRRAGRVAQPRLPARRAPTAPRWRSSTACSA